MNKVIKYLILVVSVLLLSGAFIGGCQWHKKYRSCPEIVTHTVILHDTILHRIVDSFPYYIVRRDSIVYRDTVFKDVDTNAILEDYFALHYYSRTWEDSLLSAKSEDAISQNGFVDNKFTYRILRPQSITYNQIDNSVHYNKYLLLGLSVPIQDYKTAQLEAVFVLPKFYIGAGFGSQGLSIKAGGTLFKLR
jgi:hypothetical protein